FFFFQAEDGIRDRTVTGVQTCALPILTVHERERAIEIGRKLIEKEARRCRVSMKNIEDAAFERVAGEYGFGRMEDLFAGLGYGKFSARQVLGKLVPETSDQSQAEAEAPEEPKPGALTSVVRRVFGTES